MAERRTAQYLASFRRDVAAVLSHSEREFGVAAAKRYAALIERVIQDLVEDPVRPGATTRPNLVSNTRLYHLAVSRGRHPAGDVKSPRRFVLYRYTNEHVQFARLLHDSRDLNRHVPDALRS